MKKIVALCLLVFSAVALLSGCVVVRNASFIGESIYLLTNAEKYKKYDEIAASPESVLTASLAKNEGEGMQFVFKPDEAKKNVRVTLSDLVLDGGTEKIDDVTVYYQYYHYIDDDYATGRLAGWYPDLLIPISGDCADLNGIDIEENANQGFWITVWSDKNQTTGLYRAELTVEADGDEPIKIPVEVTVWDFAVPEEHSFDAPYGYKGYAPVASYEEGYEYLLRYRLNGNRVPTVLAKNLSSEEAARVTYEYVKDHPGISHFQASMYTKEYFDELERYGILDMCHTYLYDEPDNREETNKLLSEEFARMHAMNPNIVNMVTTASRDTISDVDIWCGIWSEHDCDELTVREKQAEGYEMWWYGCLDPKVNCPTYHIQDDPISARLVHWMQKDWGIEGNLYWRVDSERLYDVSTKKTKDTLRNIYTETAIFFNSATGDSYASPAGDGYLIAYAREGDGVVNRNKILPTIRLEAVRDGSEDFEYLTLLEKKVTALFEKWGVSETSVGAYLDTYFDTLYNSMADFSRDPKGVEKMRELVAHDILHAESVVSVESAPTFENPNRRVVSAYAENGSEVVIDGKTVQGESKGNYSVFTAYFDMNTLPDETEISVFVNGEEYTRVLKSVDDTELMEESRAAVRSAAAALEIPLSPMEADEIFADNTFMAYDFPVQGTYDPKQHRCISENREYAEEVRKGLALDITNTIPLVVTNTGGDLVKAPKEEKLTLYAPKGATVRVEGKAAAFVSETDKYAIYTATLDTTGYTRYFYDVEVSLNGVCQTWRKVVFNRVGDMVSLFDLSDESLAEKLAAASQNANAKFEVVEYEGAPAVKITVDASSSFTVPSTLFSAKTLNGCTRLIVDMKSLSEESSGFAVSVKCSMGTATAEIILSDGNADGVFEGELDGGKPGRPRSVSVLAGSRARAGGTFIIRGIYAAKNPDDPAE